MKGTDKRHTLPHWSRWAIALGTVVSIVALGASPAAAATSYKTLSATSPDGGAVAIADLQIYPSGNSGVVSYHLEACDRRADGHHAENWLEADFGNGWQIMAKQKDYSGNGTCTWGLFGQYVIPRNYLTYVRVVALNMEGSTIISSRNGPLTYVITV
jgi:hypothetical protein